MRNSIYKVTLEKYKQYRKRGSGQTTLHRNVKVVRARPKERKKWGEESKFLATEATSNRKGDRQESAGNSNRSCGNSSNLQISKHSTANQGRK